MIDAEFILPASLEFVLNTIESAGYEAWCVGGCVRDVLQKKQPHDYDIASNAPTEIIEKLFLNTVPTGIKHGTVTAIVDGTPYEITRYRIDGKYSDHRKPEFVSFTASFKADLSRRDFTMNAIGYNPSKGYFDPFDGFGDIKKKIIRTVGDPQKRFNEDALRILRAIRFSSVLGFSIEKSTATAANKNAHLLNRISAERIKTEIVKMLCGKAPSLISGIINNGGLESFGLKNIQNAALLDALTPNAELRFAALCRLCNAESQAICTNLKFSNAEQRRVNSYFGILTNNFNNAYCLKPQAAFIGYDGVITAVKAKEKLLGKSFEEVITELRKAKDENAPYCIKMLNINGEILKSLGFHDREIGEVLQQLLDDILRHPEHNDTEKLKKLASKNKIV